MSALPPQVIQSTGLSNLTQDQIKRSVYVTNVSSTATLKNVSDFFSFCGNIEKMIQEVHPESDDGTQFSVVVFDSEGAYSTALLLGNAVIVDKPITVVPYSKVAPKTDLSSSSTGGGSGQHQQQYDHAVEGSGAANSSGGGHASSGDRTAASVIATLVAQGYITGETLIHDMKSQAATLDEQTNMTHRLKMALAISGAKAREFDNAYQITNTLQTIKAGASANAQKVTTGIRALSDDIESKYKIREQTGLAAQMVKDTTTRTAAEIKQKALEIEPIKQGWDWLSSGWGSLTSTVSSTITGIKHETEEEINRRRPTGTLMSQQQPQQQHRQPPPPPQQLLQPQQQQQQLQQGNKESDILNFE